MMTPVEHEALEQRLIEALAAGEALPADLQAHRSACASCALSARVLELVDGALGADEPDELAWRRFDERLRERLAAESSDAGSATPFPGPPPRAARSEKHPRASRRLRVLLAVAAAAIGVTLLAIVPRLTGTAQVATLPSRLPVTGEAQLIERIAAASEDSVELGLHAQGLSVSSDWAGDDASDDAMESVEQVSAIGMSMATAPAPAWGNVLGEIEEEWGLLPLHQQADLAAILRGES